jgi:hypothetical protein
MGRGSDAGRSQIDLALGLRPGEARQIVATWLVERTGDEIAPAFLIMASAAVTAVTLTRFRETYRALFAGGSSNAAPAYP